MAITAAQVTVDGTAGGVALNTASPSGMHLVIRNDNATATNTAVLGPSGVTSSTGYALAGGSSVTVELGPGEVLYGIRGTANSVVCHVLRSGVRS
jgi:hypothetical protein